jgi:transcriptional regulator with GAF, ATPase, and Fis domain
MTSGAFARRRIDARPAEPTPVSEDAPSRAVDDRVADDRADRALDAVRRVARLVAQEPDSTTLLRALAPLLATILHADQVLVASLSEDTLEGMISHGLPDDDLTTIAVSYALLESVAQRRSRLVLTAAHDVLPGANRRLGETGWREIVAVPALHHAGHAMAVLLIANSRRSEGFAFADIELLEAASRRYWRSARRSISSASRNRC